MIDATSVLSALAVGVLVIDAHDRIVDVNPAVVALLGMPRDALVGHEFGEIVVRDDDDRAQAAPAPTILANTVRFLRGDGKIVWGRVESTPLTVAGETYRVMALVDVSEDRRAVEELAAKARAYARSNRDLEEFAAVASHDLQEPLRKIRVFGERLATRHRDTLGDEGVDYVERMQSAATRMQALIEDLLAFSSIAWDDAPFERVSLRAVVREVASDLESALEQVQGTLHAGPLPSIDADRSQMLRLFTNLVANALKFRRPDVAPRIQVSAVLLEAWQGSPADARGETACQIVVSDNGIGFDNKHAERIFAPFRRLHGKGAYPGTGMGLAICRKIVERHRGTISARGTPGAGAEFVVTLPVRQPRDRSPST